MVCSTAILSSSLALSLLRHSTPPSKNFVLSPYSLDTALAVIHDGAVGNTETELTNLLLNGCTAADVTAHYSTMALSLPVNNASGVSFKSANRFYLNESISLKKDYEVHVSSKYRVEVEKVNFREKTAVVGKVNDFVNKATEGMITKVIDSDFITEDMLAIFINAIFFHGKWKFTFGKPYQRAFNGISGNRKMEFMDRKETFKVNFNSDLGTALVLPYKDESYKFFFFMAKNASSFATMRDSLQGKLLLDALNNAQKTSIKVSRVSHHLAQKTITTRRLLRHSAPPNQCYVLSPYSLDTALAVIHDGAAGSTQTELTNLLLNGCSAADVTAHYSAMALSLPTNNASGVAFKSANRFYINESISLKQSYQDQVSSDYQVKVENVNFREKTAVVSEVNNFVSDATNGMITNIINDAFITDDMLAMFINAIFFHGQWKFTFGETHKQTFNGISGERTIDFMSRKATFGVNWNSDGSTALVLPYKDESYKFFFLMAKTPSDFTNMLNSLSGQQLLDTLYNAEETDIEVIVPKFRVQSDLNAVPVLKSMGVSHLFDGSANLSKISEAPLTVSAIKHVALIEVSEEGTTAAAATVVGMVGMAMPMPEQPPLVIDQPFIYGIMKNDDILFIGQFV